MIYSDMNKVEIIMKIVFLMARIVCLSGSCDQISQLCFQSFFAVPTRDV